MTSPTPTNRPDLERREELLDAIRDYGNAMQSDATSFEWGYRSNAAAPAWKEVERLIAAWEGRPAEEPGPPKPSRVTCARRGNGHCPHGDADTPYHSMYRCYECGGWFHPDCMAKHFHETEHDGDPRTADSGWPERQTNLLTKLLRDYGELVIRGREHDAEKHAAWLVSKGVRVGVVPPPAPMREYHEIRLDDKGMVDDVALKCDGLHMERMDSDVWFVSAFRRGSSKATSFFLTRHGKRVEANLTENGLDAPEVPCPVPPPAGDPPDDAEIEAPTTPQGTARVVATRGEWPAPEIGEPPAGSPKEET